MPHIVNCEFQVLEKEDTDEQELAGLGGLVDEDSLLYYPGSRVDPEDLRNPPVKQVGWGRTDGRTESKSESACLMM